MKQLRRDPDTGATLCSEEIRPLKRGEKCQNCGRRNLRGNLFRFATQLANGRLRRHPHLFCSVFCFRQYNDI